LTLTLVIHSKWTELLSPSIFCFKLPPALYFVNPLFYDV
jgi:hypothetical protein